MFKSTAEFDKAVCDILVKIRDHEKWGDIPPLLDREGFTTVLNHIIDNRYVEGLNRSNTRIDGRPSITRLGLQFIESFEG